jgi:hypothetical protein
VGPLKVIRRESPQRYANKELFYLFSLAPAVAGRQSALRGYRQAHPLKGGRHFPVIGPGMELTVGNVEV